jgi:hypothetical protein
MKKNNFLQNIKDYGLLYLIIGWPIIWVILISIFSSPSNKKQVHWHMPISYDLCWDTTELRDWPEHWSLHWHNDGKIHMEWIVDLNNNTNTLWKFFDLDWIKFSKTQIWKYKNWDKCEWSTTPWKVSVLVNWKENNQFRDYILNDEDEIKIIFK